MRKYAMLWAVALVMLVSTGYADSVMQPKFSYLHDFTFKDPSGAKLDGPARVVSFDGRQGVNTTSIHSVLELKAHTMKEPRGAVTLWIMSLEDLSPFAPNAGMKKSNPHFGVYPFLSDCPNPQDFNQAGFKLAWVARWHPSLVALFGKGTIYEDAFDLPHKALISVSHFTLKARTWYQFTLTWDYEKDQYSLYVNGILIGREDQYHMSRLHRDPITGSLYLGNPTLCYADIKFYDRAPVGDVVYRQFKNEAVHFSQEIEDELLYTYAGKGRKSFDWRPDPSWRNELSLSLTKPADMENFYVQGKAEDLRITDDGLLVETVNKEMNRAVLEDQVYLWTHKTFEGDLYVEYEFKPLRPAGLSLLMVQASGMNREDFMADYPLRTSGRMTTVYGEDVRNYHWEYYREMADMRNDVENSALMKNPFSYPLSFGARNTPVAIGQWHKLQFRQIGNQLVGAIDGVMMVEFEDNGFTNNGPVYNYGHIAIRCMLRTKMLFRNVNVYSREKVKTEAVIEGERVRKNR